MIILDITLIIYDGIVRALTLKILSIVIGTENVKNITGANNDGI
ncbi:hypothetical protein ACTNDG_10940 [Clostridium sp. HCP1S3_B4]|nr:hypothetical protein [Clostridiales bacterium]MDY2729118.1 hypothetical protein [Clostridium sp.]